MNTGSIGPKYCKFDPIQNNLHVDEQVIKLNKARGEKKTHSEYVLK